jgi:dipeptidyl aminopeptidase/acylaminoacyl peptidase
VEKKVEFYSEGSLIKGILYLPEQSHYAGKYPTIILNHGFAGVKEFLLPNFARRFCQNGYAALTFDYRGFGESEGIPGKLSPQNQIIDIRNALTFLQSFEEIDAEKIGLWGTSYGGANSIVVAGIDKRVKCLVAQLTFGDGARVITNHLSEEEKERLNETLMKVWVKTVVKNKVMLVGIDKVLTDEQSLEFYRKNVEKTPSLKIKLPFLTIKETMEYKPEQYLKMVDVPILIVGAENDRVNPKQESESLYEKANHPKELFMVKQATHYDLYEGDKFEKVVQKQLEWFNKYLKLGR